MEIQALRTFQAVVEEGGILSAARRLNTVQSNVTARIKRLEEEVGVELFYRQGRGLELAPSGRVLLDYARQILQLESQAIMAVRQVGDKTGELRIGAMETFAALRLPLALSSLRQSYPELDLRVTTDTSGGLLDKLLKHQLDCAFVGGPVEHPELLTSEVLQETLVLVHAHQTDYCHLPLILFREGCVYRERALLWQRECGHPFSEVMEFGTLDGILGCVAIGLGCTLVPQWVVDNSRYQQALAVEALPSHIATVPTIMARHRHTLPLKALAALAGVVEAQPAFIK
ncbi:LysR substrate-binding domain-containing protein [Candidatus Thiothrix sp. Deng01]|uniref:LysR substrate-binding domain-containing protein n=1 Tax=Candidatus Thiothrix phosphatis TaxID=3112415 RepID=A0ABU6D1Z5_9GAMM|nr:LysR substrate-binding domain-containing protein [Candidatus Thiothrix sp. Deng01]MEB4593097.1 LysR substrate-binding domain-containing protein [Candidatus Thiothrix sp. Deng01]